MLQPISICIREESLDEVTEPANPASSMDHRYRILPTPLFRVVKNSQVDGNNTSHTPISSCNGLGPSNTISRSRSTRVVSNIIN